MNKYEMHKELKRLGRRTKRNALLVSIAHWKKIGLICYWSGMILNTFRKYFPRASNCSLCWYYNNKCEKCELHRYSEDEGNDCIAAYYDAIDAIFVDDREEFLRARRKILYRLNLLLRKEEERLAKRKLNRRRKE